MSSQIIVITGSTRGVGYALAEAFLQLDCAVVVGGRDRETSAAAAARLAERYDPALILGCPCDVSDPAQTEALWAAACARFGKIHIWINNAGAAGEHGMVWERPAAEVQSVVNANLMGAIFGSQVAMRGMLAQGYGALYNMEGMGSDGRKHAGLTYYGVTKYALHYFTESLALEAARTPVIVGALRPGMVATALLRDRYLNRPEEWERAKKIFNILAEPADKVAPWLARNILSNRRNGAILSYSSTWKLLWKFAISPFIKRNLFD